MSDKRANRLTWSRQPSETGLARVCQMPRGRDGKVAGKRVCSVRPNTNWPSRSIVGWYWSGWGVNSYSQGRTWPTLEEAQADATAYWKANHAQLAKEQTP